MEQLRIEFPKFYSDSTLQLDQQRRLHDAQHGQADMNKIPMLLVVVFYLGCVNKSPTAARTSGEVAVVQVRGHGFESDHPTVRYAK